MRSRRPSAVLLQRRDVPMDYPDRHLRAFTHEAALYPEDKGSEHAEPGQSPMSHRPASAHGRSSRAPLQTLRSSNPSTRRRKIAVEEKHIQRNPTGGSMWGRFLDNVETCSLPPRQVVRCLTESPRIS